MNDRIVYATQFVEALLRIRNEPFYVRGFVPKILQYESPDTDEWLAVSGHENIFKKLLAEAEWVHKENTPRNECFMATDLTRTYSYGSQARDRTYTASAMHPIVKSIMELINGIFDTKFNVCVLNAYADQHQHLGWHADDSPEQDLTHPIAVVSFGAERQIWVKPKEFKGNVPAKNKFSLASGSLFIMPGGFQDDHYHKIPKHDRPCGGRISLTYRKLDR